MKVLLCHNYYQQRGGEDASFESEAALLEAKGHEVVRYTRHNDDIRDMGLWATARVTLWNPETYGDVSELIRGERPDVMHCTNTFPLISPSIHRAARDAGVPVVQSLRNYRPLCANGYLHRAGRVCEDCLGTTIPWPALRHGCYRDSRAATAVVTALQLRQGAWRRWSPEVDVYFTPTEFARRKFVEGGFPAERIVVKPNFLETDPGAGTGGGGHFVFVGRLSPEKGVPTLLSAWSTMRDAPPLAIVGDGPLAEPVRRAAADSDRITWHGEQPHAEVLRIIGDAAGLICPSTWYETFGRTVMEAFARGTPVVASRLGALTELVDEGRTGVLCEPGNPRHLALQIKRLCDAPGDLERMRQAARAEFEQHYTAPVNHRLLVAIYERAAGRCRAAADPAVPQAVTATPCAIETTKGGRS